MKNKAISMQKVLKSTIKKIVPQKKETIEQQKLAQEILNKIMKTKGKHLEAELVGSNARGTQLRGDNDLDIFVFYPKEMPRKEFEEEGLKIGKTIFRGHTWEKAYSEHPYIRGKIKGFDVEIVPAYKIIDAHELQSAVDRTSFHNKYLQTMLSEEQKNEVRLLKQFLKGINAYGADLKYASVPGYVTELLVVHYGSFTKTIEAMQNWQNNQVIDIEKQLSEKEAKQKFDFPLIIVDPVDKNRNVAAALSKNQFARMIAAARAFFAKPSMNFFFTKKSKPMPTAKAKKLVQKEGLIVAELGYPKKEISDVLWGQIKSISRKISSQLEQKDFKVLRNTEWTDEEKSIIIVFDLEANKLEKVEKRMGPEVTSEQHSQAFLKTHKKPVSGPRIEEGRWVVEIDRKEAIATKFIQKLLKGYKKTEKSGIKKALNKKAKVLTDAETILKYKKDAGFRDWFSNYLKGKEEFW